MRQKGKGKIPQKNFLPRHPTNQIYFVSFKIDFSSWKLKTIPIARGGMKWVQIWAWKLIKIPKKFTNDPFLTCNFSFTWRNHTLKSDLLICIFSFSLTSIVIIDCVIWNRERRRVYASTRMNALKNIFTWIYWFFVCRLKSWSTSR